MLRKTTIRLFAVVVGIVVAVSSFAGAVNVLAIADPEWAGTFDDGIVSANGGEQGSINTVGTTEGVANGDFEKGLMYWGTTLNGTNVKLSDNAKIVKDGDNHYLQFDGVVRGQYCGFKSPRISLPKSKVSVGDKLAVVMDIKGDISSVQIKYDQGNVTSGATAGSTNQMASSMTVLKPATVSNEWMTIAHAESPIKPIVASAATAPNVTEDGDYLIRITVAVPSDKTSVACIDNIRIAKVVDGKYYDVMTGEEIKKVDVSTEENLFYGTADTGFKATPQNTPTMDQARNLDFSEGLRYWTGGNGSVLPTEHAEVVADGTSKALHLTTETQYAGVMMAPFEVTGIKPGDKLTVVYEWKGCAATDIQVRLDQYDKDDPYTSKSGSYAATALGAASSFKVYEAANADEWNASAAKPGDNSVIKAENTDKYIFRLVVQTMVKGNTNASIRNLRLALVGADGKTLTDLATGKVISYTSGGVATLGGTPASTTGTTGGTGTGKTNGTSNKTGESIAMLAALFFVSGASVFGASKALKKSR